VYFKRAHQSYFISILQFINFIVITYTLLFVNLLGFPNAIEYLLVYAICFILIYFPLCIYIGYRDFKKGLYPIEAKVIGIHNPVLKDLLTAIYYIAKNENSKAIEILKKYVST